MTVKGGAADIIENINDGAMILCLSGGLHHVQTPGQHFPRPFKTIRMNLSYVDLNNFKSQFSEFSPRERKLKITRLLQDNLESNCPKDFET
jgi:hypothetical protein